MYFGILIATKYILYRYDIMKGDRFCYLFGIAERFDCNKFVV